MAKKRRSRVVGIGASLDQKWQVESDLSTLQQACVIRKDPKRFAAAQALAKEKLVELGKIMGDEGYEKK